MELLDSTLREGEQCYGVFFTVGDKIRIARLLDTIGVDFIEVGHPAAAPSIQEAAAAIARLGLRARLVGHARLDPHEIRLVQELGVPWVGLFSGINAFSLARYGASRGAVMERIQRSVLLAKEIGLSVRFTCEDASRTSVGELEELYGMVLELGADRISYADTVGIDTPERLLRLHACLKRQVTFRSLHFHFHDDRGTALANAGAAASLGARCMDASVLGIGERSGIVALEALLSLMDQCSSNGEGPGDGSAGAIRSVQSIVKASIDYRRFARRRFAHKSGIHIHGVLLDPCHYEHADPVDAGEQRRIVLSKLIGRTGLRMLLSAHGISTDESGLHILLQRVKSDDRLELADPDEVSRYLGGCLALTQSFPVC